MRKTLLFFLCALVLLSSAVPALAAEDDPPAWLYPPAAGEEPDAPPHWLYPDGVPAASEASDPASESGPGPSSESAGETDETNTPGNSADLPPASVDSSSSGGYPVGSFIAPSGQVWSPSGEILSPLAPEAEAVDEVSPAPLDVLDRSEGGGQVAVTPGTAYVMDLRPKAVSPESPAGLKALAASIFGAYTPVTTTSAVTRTVGDDAYQYLVETVAPGSAGVDYEWVAGVVLFGLLLFCLMRLLGGVLK